MNGGLAVLGASCKPIERTLFLLFFVVFVGLAALVAVVDGPKVDVQRNSVTIATVIAFPVFVLWGGWASRMLVLLLHARNLRIPGLPAQARGGMLMMACATVLLPGIACIACGGLPGIVFGVLVLAAAGGMMFALAPRGLAPLTGFGMLALGQLGHLRPDGLPLSVLLPLLALVLAALAVWRGRVVARNPEAQGEADWSQPMLFSTAMRGSFWGGRDLLDARAQLATLPRWARRIDSVGNLGPAAPVRSLRTLLGGVFSPMGRRQLLATLAGWAVGLLFIWFFVGRDAASGRENLLFFSLFGGACLLVAPLPMRLQALQRDHAGELCEAALLPGWGNAHATMLRATMRIHAMWFLGFAAWMTGCALYIGHARVLPLVIVAIVGTGVLGIAAWMRPLSGRPWMTGPWTAVLSMAVGAVLAGATLVAVLPGGSWTAPMVVWATTIVAAGASAGRSLRRFNARPHPFLME